MQKLVWTTDFSIGIESIDEEHRRLFETINLIHNALIFEEPKFNELQTHFQKLIDYTIYHFGHEEEIMKKLNYPKLKEHKAEHDKLVDDVYDYVKKIEEHSPKVNSHDILDFLEHWVKDHILEWDLDIRKFKENSK